MAKIRSFQVSADGSIAPCDESSGAPKLTSNLSAIIETLKANDNKPGETLRLIAIEIATRTKALGECKSVADLRAISRDIKSLSVLRESVFQNQMRAPSDGLNFSGAKFAFAISEALKIFEKSATDALGQGDDTRVRSIMKLIEERLAEAMPRLEREAERIGAAPETSD